MKQALLMIDVQNALVEAKPYQITKRIAIWKRAISWARESGIEVIFIQHQDDDIIEGSHGWQIYSELAPKQAEKKISKSYNSAFKNTGLKAYLDEQGIESLIIAGMQTEYCVDTTIKVAFEYGYTIFVIENGTTTFEAEDIEATTLIEHYENIWADRFAEVDFLEELIKEEK